MADSAVRSEIKSMKDNVPGFLLKKLIARVLQNSISHFSNGSKDRQSPVDKSWYNRQVVEN